MNIKSNITRLATVLAFIQSVRYDFQLDFTDEEYVGYINIDPQDHPTAMAFVELWQENNTLAFMLLAQVGLIVESISADELVIYDTALEGMERTKI